MTNTGARYAHPTDFSNATAPGEPNTVRTALAVWSILAALAFAAIFLYPTLLLGAMLITRMLGGTVQV